MCIRILISNLSFLIRRWDLEEGRERSRSSTVYALLMIVFKEKREVVIDSNS
jgi:hypothetical protein